MKIKEMGGGGLLYTYILYYCSILIVKKINAWTCTYGIVAATLCCMSLFATQCACSLDLIIYKSCLQENYTDTVKFQVGTKFLVLRYTCEIVFFFY